MIDRDEQLAAVEAEPVVVARLLQGFFETRAERRRIVLHGAPDGVHLPALLRLRRSIELRRPEAVRLRQQLVEIGAGERSEQREDHLRNGNAQWNIEFSRSARRYPP